MVVENGKTYVGIVEDNNDPKKLGRVRIRVLDVFDNTPKDDLPWANPWKDLVGDEFKIPDIGKVVTVVFENANINNPEFVFSDHYNINLEKKLTQLSESNYATMKSLIFDHKTQIYVNDEEGLKLDHKFNNVNIKDKSIDINLKDNFGRINIGTSNSTQRIILGDNFLNWFDDFVNVMLGGKGGPFLGNLQAPVVATPALIDLLIQYQEMKEPKFLSKNVYSSDNETIEKLDRIADGQLGDDWQSTVQENKLTTKEDIPFLPISGSSDTTFNQPPIDTSTNSIISTVVPKPKNNPDIDTLLHLIEMKKYKLYEGEYQLNIIAIRNQCNNIGDKYSNTFSDKLYVLYKFNNEWVLKQYNYSTMPGTDFTITESWLVEKNLSLYGNIGETITMKEFAIINSNDSKYYVNGLPILVPAQYVDIYQMSTYRGQRSFILKKGASQLVWRDNDINNLYEFRPNNYSNPEIIKPTNILQSIKVHLGYPNGIKVANWSDGSHTFSNKENLNEFFDLCEKHRERYKDSFTYTLVLKRDFDEAKIK